MDVIILLAMFCAIGWLYIHDRKQSARRKHIRQFLADNKGTL
jgi:hypothetical protein